MHQPTKSLEPDSFGWKVTRDRKVDTADLGVIMVDALYFEYLNKRAKIADQMKGNF